MGTLSSETITAPLVSFFNLSASFDTSGNTPYYDEPFPAFIGSVRNAGTWLLERLTGS